MQAGKRKTRIRWHLKDEASARASALYYFEDVRYYNPRRAFPFRERGVKRTIALHIAPVEAFVQLTAASSDEASVASGMSDDVLAITLGARPTFRASPLISSAKTLA
jgi:hypothetical protein